MKLGQLGSLTERKNVKFESKRTLKNAISQLAKNNKYSLTEPNQRLITNSITELSKIKGNKNIQFLLDTAAKTTYSTNIVLKDLPKNNWKQMLLSAAMALIAITPFVPKELKERVNELSKPQAITKEEKEILKLRESLLALVDLKQISNETKGASKNFEKNLDYFIISSETTLKDKKYVLEQLNYLMSDDYQINEQLKDKKSIVVAEMINDMAISVPGSNPPNIKAVNQKQHGMCAAISIVRKKIAYENKPQYVDSIISELDNTPNLIVYDRNALGSGKKTVVEKVPVDFKTALANGYRIIDASAMHWMFIAKMSGENNFAYNNYHPFDKENFDVKTDAFLNSKFDNPELEKIQDFYQAILFTQEKVDKFKANKIKKLEKVQDIKMNQKNNIKVLNSTISQIRNELRILSPNSSDSEIVSLSASLIELQKPNSDKITNNDFEYIPNEEAIVKKEKVKNFIKNNLTIKSMDDKNTETIFELLNSYHNIVESNQIASKESEKINHAKKLYEIAASYRYMVIKGLDNDFILKDSIMKEELPNKESIMLNHVDDLISKLENNSPYSELIMNQVLPLFDENIITKQDVINALKELKILTNDFLTNHIDDIYRALTIDGRHAAIISFLNNSIQNINNGDYKSMEIYANNFGFKKTLDGVAKGLEDIKSKIESGDNDVYIDTLNKLGHFSQVEYLSKLHESILDKFSDENYQDEQFLMEFLVANGLELKDDPEIVVKRLEDIKLKIDSLKEFFKMCTESLRIKGENGEVLFSADPKDIIIKKYEKQGRIASIKQLKELQEHFIKIAKIKSSDEFQSRRGKIKDSKIKNFSKSENETIKTTEKNINFIYSEIRKNLKSLQKDYKEDFERLNRSIGVNTGHYWVSEGGSGLYKEEQIRLLEYMTGRPHYVSKDLKKAIETIKNSPYSGISGSSVFHNEAGMHAQYIADIKPVKVKIKDENGNVKEITREILFQDNTWGASELENTWIDSQGLKRTDYSDNRGGTLGYITNENYQNGNFVDRILNEMVVIKKPEQIESKLYKKIKRSEEKSYEFSQYGDMILDGKSPKVRSVSDAIHDAIFVPSRNYLPKLSKIGKNLSSEKLKNLIKDNNLAGKTWKITYEELKKRIFPTGNQEPITLEMYNNLADNDYLKVVLEKIAIKRRYQLAGLEADLARVTDVNDLKKFKKAQNQRAFNEIKYVFGKDLTVVDYLVEAYGDEEDEKLEKILEKYNIQLKDEDAEKLITFKLKENAYNGSVKSAINEMLNYISDVIDNITPNLNAQKELKDFFKEFMTRVLYFNESDLDMYEIENQKYKYIIDFIDREFNPSDDKEFVKIFRKIQDMTLEEFRDQILPKMSDEDFGVKDTSGYEILKEIRHYNDKSNRDFMNTIYYDNLVKDTNEKNLEPIYHYERFNRRITYKLGNDFRTYYNNIKSDLSLLTYPKLFNKYKGRNLDNYGAYPAYPKLEPVHDGFARPSFDHVVKPLKENIDMINQINTQLATYNIVDALIDNLNNVDETTNIIGEDYDLVQDMMSKFITLNQKDEALKHSVENAYKAMGIQSGATWRDYIPYISEIVNEISTLRESASVEQLLEIIDTKKGENEGIMKGFVSIFIQPRYRNTIQQKLTEFEKALQNPETNQEELEIELYNIYKKYHIANDPETLLDVFVESTAKDSKYHDFAKNYQIFLEHCLTYAKLVDIQDIIMDAINKGIAINAKSKFNQHRVVFPSGSFGMGSNEMISYIIDELVVRDDFETALLFLDKLGLSETYVEAANSLLKFDVLKETLDKSYNLISKFQGFKDETEVLFKDFGDKIGTDNFDIGHIDAIMENIRDKGKKYDLEDSDIEVLLKAFDYFKTNVYNQTNNITTTILYNTIIGDAKKDIVENIAKKVREYDNLLLTATNSMNFINKIILEENSKAWDLRIKMNENYAKLEEYRQELFKNLQQG